jgi:AhpD family alkylhydroperoxidase
MNMAVMENKGRVTSALKRLIAFVSSNATGCRYCQAHTIRAAERYNATQEQLEHIWDFRTHPAFSEAERAALNFSIAASLTPNQVDETIGETLSAVLDLVQAGDFKDIDLLPKQMARLTDAIADIRKKEAEFNDKFGTGLAEGEIDFDQLRREIGCRLGRIRRCCRT